MTKKTWIWIGVTVGLAGLGVGAYFLLRKKPTDSNDPQKNNRNINVVNTGAK